MRPNSSPQRAFQPKAAERSPLLWGAIAYGGGLFLGSFAWRPPLWWLIATVMFAGASAFLSHRRARTSYGLALSVLFVLGAFTIQVVSVGRAPGQNLFSFTDGQQAIITAHVVKEGIFQQSGLRRLDLQTEQIETDGHIVPAQIGIRASLYGKDSLEPPAQLHYGDRIRFATKLYQPHNYRDPGAFDYAAYLKASGILAVASAKGDEVELLPGFSGNRPEHWRTNFHRQLIQRIHALWPPAEASLVDAMLVGENEFVGRALLTDFQRTGTYHVLVISGLKVGILALVTFWFLRRLRFSNMFASAAAVVVIIAYAVLTDVGVPVWRAALMLSVYFTARLFYRSRAVLNTIGAAALALLLLDSSGLFGASFQMSFLCILIIAGIGSPLLERSTQPLKSALRNLDFVTYDYALPPKLVQIRLDLRMVAARLQRFVGARLATAMLVGTARLLLLASEFLIISIILQIGFALPMAYYFHRVTLISLPANVLAVPLTEIAMIASIVTLAISTLSFNLVCFPAKIAGLAVLAMAGSVHRLGALLISDSRIPTPGLPLVLVALAVLVFAIAVARRRAMFALAGVLLLSASAVWISVAPQSPRVKPGVLEITAIDVGEGDAILVVSPTGYTLLIDAGGIPHWMHSDLDIGEDVVSPYLWSRGFRRLDAVAVTHPHADHIGGMSAVLANFRPRQLWLSSGANNSEAENLRREAASLGIAILSPAAGDRIEEGGLLFRVLAPQTGAVVSARKTNDDSLVVRVSYGNTSALLEGDAEKESEKYIAEEKPVANLLKVAHHGSATSTTPELLSAVHPQFAMISVGARNVYGHPRPEVLERLAESHVKTFRTDLDGAVSFYLDGNSVTPWVASLH